MSIFRMRICEGLLVKENATKARHHGSNKSYIRKKAVSWTKKTPAMEWDALISSDEVFLYTAHSLPPLSAPIILCQYFQKELAISRFGVIDECAARHITLERRKMEWNYTST